MLGTRFPCPTITYNLATPLPPTILQIIEDVIQQDDETKVSHLQAKLASHNVYMSLSTIYKIVAN